MTEELEQVNQKYVDEYIPVIVLVSTVLFVGLTRNIFALIFYSWKTQKYVNQFLIVSLLVNDVLTNLVLVDEVVDFFNTVNQRVGSCKVFWVLKHWLVGNSLFFMVTVSIERFLHVCCPFSRHLTPRAAKHMIIWTVVFSFLLSARYFVTADVVRNNLTAEVNSTQGYYCSLSNVYELQAIEEVFHWVDICTHVIIICSLIVFYSLIVRKIIHSNRRLHLHERLGIVSYKKKRLHRETLNESNNTEVVEIHFVTTQDNTGSSSNHENFPTLDNDIKQTCQAADSENCNINHHVAETNVNQTMRKRITNSNQQMKSIYNLSLSSRIEIRITVMVTVITIASVASFVAYYVFVLVVTADISGRGLILGVGEVIWRSSFILNSVINPFIMVIFNAPFRQFVGVICCCKFKDGE